MSAHLTERYAAAVAPGAGLGLRQGEVFGLAVDDVDFLRGVVHVVRQVKIVGSRPHHAPPKGGKVRDVPLPGSVRAQLAEHLRRFPAVEVTLPWLATGKPTTARLVFTTPGREAIRRSHSNDRAWKKALRAAGVTDARENGFHALRHCFASVLLDAGVSVKALADHLGHADPAVTLRVYTHLMPAAEDRTRQAVDAAFSTGGAPDARQAAR